MYDISFIRNAADIKDRIVSGDYRTGDAARLSGEFEALRSKRPNVFNLETTNHCNMRCVMCPRTTMMKRNKQLIEKSDFQRVIDQIAPHDETALAGFWDFVTGKYEITPETQSEDSFYFHVVSKCLILHGYGEPLLDPKIVDYVQQCTARGIPTYFSCVPANIRLDKIQKLMESGLTVLKFSMDALEDEKQKRIRGKHNDFTRSFEKIQQVLSLKERCGYQTRIVVTLIALGAFEDEVTMQQDFMRLWDQYDVYNYVKSQDNRWYFEDDPALENNSHYASQYCEYPWTSLSVMANGEVVPCTQDYDTEMSFGNVRDRSLEEIWNGEEYARFREWHLTGNFPEGHKCAERCDQVKLFQRLAD